MADAIALYRSKSPTDEISELFIVLATLGMYMVPLGVINLHDLDSARTAVRQAISVTSPTFATRYDALDEQLKGVITCALVLCAECYPMKIYHGFGVGVYNDWLWAAKCWESGTCTELDRIIAAVKDERKDFWLLRKVPTGMSRIQPIREKIPLKQRKDMVKAREDMAKRLEKKGFPQPHDKSFKINAWWIPFATWDSAFLLYNEGHSFERSVRWQTDPGRLLYAFIVDRELNLRDGELMLVPAGPGECLVRWLEGLQGMGIKIVPEVDLNIKGLGLSSSTRDTLHFHGRQDAYVIRDHHSAPRRPSAPHLPTTHYVAKTISSPSHMVEMPGDTTHQDSALCVSTVRPPPYTTSSSSRPRPEASPVILQPDSFKADDRTIASLQTQPLSPSQTSFKTTSTKFTEGRSTSFLRGLMPGGKT
ncbi:hypothetical protein EJ05DRAFT_485154 [Pseudovirgaria hyperparasitica]|uniref:Uncharacterized protein n=1 Tax=Pseudovirgaria hyperparasitica TaxID=470096 RepID=A0A6A6W861_9PEZI|nr:uncharacterized protein EJ05DRAFT_485154 [Pseudovirgaria hyperparasitica]KAF2759078.1 hypothetical protein EJ05DRAFT_485154 [Pseudovirgaria hyperparasitica]